MLCINSSEIAKITGYNTYTKKDDFINLFEKNLYKKREDLMEFDEENIGMEFLTDKEITQNLIKNLDKDSKNIINNIIESKIIDNITLKQNLEKLEVILNNSTINDKEKNKIKNEMNNKLNCNYGTNTEDKAIKIYEKNTSNKVYDNNTKCYTKLYSNFLICGKIDGLIKQDGTEYINEIKNRRNRIFDSIPVYEKIQLLSYTKLLDNTNIIFTQCMDEEQYTEILNDYKDDELWYEILDRLEKYSILIYKLRDSNKLRHEYINKDTKIKYKYLKKELNWLNLKK